jgi:branched-chain amino acid transport system substrate-binding protein
MKRTSLNTSAFAGAIMLVGLAAPVRADQEIKIGLMLPMKGVFAQLAQDIDKAWVLALENRNYTVAGKKIRVLKEDTEADPTVGVRKANRLVNSEKVDLMAGIVSSGVGLALSDIALNTKKPLVLALAVADEITAEKCNPYVARTAFSAHALESGSGAYWAKHLKNKTAVTLGPDYSAGRAQIRGFVDGFTKNGGTIKEELWSVFRQTKDWAPLLTKAKESGAGIIYAWYAGADSVQVVKQHAGFAMRETMPLHGAQWLYDVALWPAMGEENIVGARYITAYTPAIDTPASKAFVTAWRAKYNEEPNVTAALGYDNVMAVIGGIEKRKGDMSDGAAFISAVRGLTIDSPRGKITFSKANNAQMEHIYAVEIVKDAHGKLAEKLNETLSPGDDLPGCRMN